MKNIILTSICLIVVTLLCACGAEQLSHNETDGMASIPSETSALSASFTPSASVTPSPAPYVPEISPGVVGIYIPKDDGTSARKLIKEFKAERTSGTDIDCFEIFASESEVIEGGSFAKMWSDAWNSHGENPSAKIGFKIEFDLSGGGSVSKNVLKPSDSAEFFEFVEIYIYDDINQDGGWYTHLDDEDVVDSTVMSSIKLTSGRRIDEVGGIKLSAFIYDGADNFDSNGEYIGAVISEIVISE